MSTLISAGTSTSGAVINSDTSGSLQLQTGSTPTTAVTIDTAQNVGVGVTPSTWSSGKATEIGFVGNGVFGLANNNFLITQNAYYNSGFKYASGSSLQSSYYQQTNGTHAWGIAGAGTAGNAITYTTGMTLNNNGKLYLGSPTNIAGFTVKMLANSYQSGLAVEQFSGTNYWSLITSTSNNLYFGYNNTDTAYINNATGAFVPLSDQRLKKDIIDISYGLNTILSLRPVSYLMISQEDTEQRSLGFIAQEAMTLIPESVSEMNSGMYGMDKTSIVPILVKAIQELSAKVTALEAKVGA